MVSPRPPLQFVRRQQQHRPHLPFEGSAVECFLRGLQERVAVHRGPSAATHDHDVPRGAFGALDGPQSVFVAKLRDLAEHDGCIGRVLGVGRIEEEARRQELRGKLLAEAEHSARHNATVAMRWADLFSIEVPQELYEQIEKQREACTRITDSKDRLIKEINNELKAKDDEYVKALKKQAEDIDQLLKFMGHQFRELQVAFAEELEEIEPTDQEVLPTGQLLPSLACLLLRSLRVFCFLFWRGKVGHLALSCAIAHTHAHQSARTPRRLLYILTIKRNIQKSQSSTT